MGKYFNIDSSVLAAIAKPAPEEPDMGDKILSAINQYADYDAAKKEKEADAAALAKEEAIRVEKERVRADEWKQKFDQGEERLEISRLKLEQSKIDNKEKLDIQKDKLALLERQQDNRDIKAIADAKKRIKDLELLNAKINRYTETSQDKEAKKQAQADISAFMAEAQQMPEGIERNNFIAKQYAILDSTNPTVYESHMDWLKESGSIDDVTGYTALTMARRLSGDMPGEIKEDTFRTMIELKRGELPEGTSFDNISFVPGEDGDIYSGHFKADFRHIDAEGNERLNEKGYTIPMAEMVGNLPKAELQELQKASTLREKEKAAEKKALNTQKRTQENIVYRAELKEAMGGVDITEESTASAEMWLLQDDRLNKGDFGQANEAETTFGKTGMPWDDGASFSQTQEQKDAYNIAIENLAGILDVAKSFTGIGRLEDAKDLAITYYNSDKSIPVREWMKQKLAPAEPETLFNKAKLTGNQLKFYEEAKATGNFTDEEIIKRAKTLKP